MKKLIFLLCAYCITITSTLALTEQEMLQSVLKIKVYNVDTLSSNFVFEQYGSAVYIGKNQIITNAHVISDSIDDPYLLYEVCRSSTGKKVPECFTTAQLIAYDTESDLALLELKINIKDIKAPSIVKTDLNPGEQVITYGYPGIGGNNITRTEGKIGGYENDQYKFDGTIDRGSSGGGVFDKQGNLVALSVAVASDNGVIGYLISGETIKNFLAKKTDNYTLAKDVPVDSFAPYIRQIQSLYKSSNLFKTPHVTLKDAGKSGFTLSGAVESIDRSIFDYRFHSKNQKTSLMVSCQKSAQNMTTSLDTQIIDLTAYFQDQFSGRSIIESNTTDKEFISLSITDQNTSGPVAKVIELIPRKNENCSMTIISLDHKKFKKDIDQALKLAKSIRFEKIAPPASSLTTDYFSVKNIPENMFVSEGTSLESPVINSSIAALFGSQFFVSADAERYSFEDMYEVMDLGYESNTRYREKDFSWEAFVKRYTSASWATEGKLVYETLYTKNKKRILFLTTKDPNSDIFNTRIDYYYKDENGNIRAILFDFKYRGMQSEFEQKIKILVQNMVIEGKSPFSN